MKIVSREFYILLGTIFFAREFAYINHKKDLVSYILLLALIKKTTLQRKFLNNVNIKEIDKGIISSLNSEAKMKIKQDNLYICDTL